MYFYLVFSLWKTAIFILVYAFSVFSFVYFAYIINTCYFSVVHYNYLIYHRASSSKSKKQTEESQNSFLSLSIDAKEKGKSAVNPAKRRKKDEIEVVLSDTNGSSEDDTESLSEGDTSVVPDVATVPPSKKDEKETLQLSLEEVS